jgi:hypothetical protein
MRELGYVEGKDFVSEWRSVEGNYERAKSGHCPLSAARRALGDCVVARLIDYLDK